MCITTIRGRSCARRRRTRLGWPSGAGSPTARGYRPAPAHPTPPVSRRSRQPATGPPGSCPDRMPVQITPRLRRPKVRRNIYQNEDVPRDILQFKQEGRFYGRINNVLQRIAIVGSIGASTLSGLIQSNPQLRWVTVGATLSVGVAAGFSGYFKFKERSFYAQQTADDIEHELSAVILGISPYGSEEREDNIRAFTEKVEKMKHEQRKRQQQLEQQSAAPRENTQ